MPEIEDIMETPEKAALLLAWQWLALAILSILVIWAIFAFIKHQKQSPNKTNNLKEALAKLKEIAESPISQQSEQNNNQLTIQLSLLTREYLQAQLSNKSIFQTHEEFIIDHQDLEKLPESARKKLSSYLTALAQHKYSPDQHLPTEKNKLIRLTESLLRGIDSTIPQL